VLDRLKGSELLEQLSGHLYLSTAQACADLSAQEGDTPSH
jgi:hypothetical protein